MLIALAQGSLERAEEFIELAKAWGQKFFMERSRARYESAGWE